MDRNTDEVGSTSGTSGTSGTRGIWRTMMWGGLAMVLALPMLAMALGAEGVFWTASDFVIMGALLIAMGVLIEAVMRLVRGRRQRRTAIGAIAVLALLAWAELAVGLFGTPFAGS